MTLLEAQTALIASLSVMMMIIHLSAAVVMVTLNPAQVATAPQKLATEIKMKFMPSWKKVMMMMMLQPLSIVVTRVVQVHQNLAVVVTEIQMQPARSHHAHMETQPGARNLLSTSK